MQDEYKILLKDKRVCIVGPSPGIMGEGSGELIDSFDVVVRINHGWPIPQEYVKDYGRRTDVLYHLLRRGAVKTSKSITEAKNDGVSWVVSVYPESQKHRVNDFLKLNNGWNGIVNFRCVEEKTRQTVRNTTRSSPNSGIIAILDLLDNGVKELYVTGFSFYVDGYYPGYGGRKGITSPITARGGHNQENHLEYFRRLYKEDKRLRVDKKLHNIIGLQRITILKGGSMDLTAKRSFIYYGKKLNRGMQYQATRTDGLSHIRRGMAHESPVKVQEKKPRPEYRVVHRGGPWYDVEVGGAFLNEQPIKGKENARKVGEDYADTQGG